MILVTGAAGFIGSHLVKGLVEKGERIFAVDRIGRMAKLKGEGIARLHPVEQLCAGDLSGVKAVYHMGAISSTMETDEALLHRYNTQATLNLFDLCAEQEIPIAYASSAATYGDGGNGFSDDCDLLSLKPLNAYARSKHQADIAISRRRMAPPRWYGLKFFNVYGTGEEHKGPMRSVLSQLVSDAVSGRPMRLFKDGTQRRDWIAVEDAVSASMHLMRSKAPSGLYNIGTGEAPTFLALAQAIAEETGARTDWIEMPQSLLGKYQSLTVAKIEKLRATGFDKPFITVEDGARALIASLQQRQLNPAQ